MIICAQSSSVEFRERISFSLLFYRHWNIIKEHTNNNNTRYIQCIYTYELLRCIYHNFFSFECICFLFSLPHSVRDSITLLTFRPAPLTDQHTGLTVWQCTGPSKLSHLNVEKNTSKELLYTSSFKSLNGITTGCVIPFYIS